MNYEQKYKEALGWMQSLYKGLHGITKEDAEHYFPELKESEDERIRKEILNVFKQLDEGTTICGRNYDYAKWIAWLEKQGKALDADKVIEKACEWLDNELPKYIFEGRNGKPYISVAMVDDFKKAMKGDQNNG